MAESELLSMGQEQPGLPLSLSFSGIVWHPRRAMNWSGFAEVRGDLSL